LVEEKKKTNTEECVIGVIVDLKIHKPIQICGSLTLLTA